MALKDLLPAAEDWQRLQDLESKLVRRKTAGTFAGALAAIAGALQIVFTLADKKYFNELLTFLASGSFRFDAIDRKKAITLAIFIVSVTLYLVLRRTRLLVRESADAFRYTFWIDPFAEVTGTPGDHFELLDRNRLALLHHDLMERLDQRIRRFSILQEAPKQEDDDTVLPVQKRRYSSHVHISGHYAVREGEDGHWYIHVMPIVRIGAASAPATLAHPVHFPLSTTAAGGKLDPASYRDIVEHVYSSIATEVYRQLESDVRKKIELFPTAHLRAVALYREAEDFARSNTIDAYERAIGLYRESLRWYELSRIETITRLFLRLPILWRTEIRAQHEWARVVAGYAKCLIYRRRVSALTGRAGNALYELPSLIGQAIEVLELLQKKIGKRSSDSKVERLLAFLMYPRDAWFRRLLGISYTPVFEAQNEALFEIYLVDCLAMFDLDRRRDAMSRLEDAAAMAPDRLSVSPLYLFARGLIDAELEARILTLRAAVDLDREFQIARSALADAYENLFREDDEITPERAGIIVDEHKAVLSLNYGNIRALSSLGLICWLIRDERARQYLEQGRQVKAIAGQTFIGELSYRLARVAAEDGRFEECRNLYLEATAADPEVAAYEPDMQSGARSGLEFLGRNILRRFESYLEKVETNIAASQTITHETRRAVHSFALNDVGNAYLRYFHFHGDRYWLQRAIHSYRRAAEINPVNAIPWFNLQNAYGWSSEYEKIEEAYKRAKELAPSWTTVAIAAVKGRVETSAEALRKEIEALEECERKLQRNDEALKSAKLALDTRRTRHPGGAARQAPQAAVANVKVINQRLNQLQATSLSGEHPVAGASEPSEQILGLEKAHHEVSRQKDAILRRKNKMESEFQRARIEALEEIRGISRLAAVFDGASLPEQVERLRSIPAHKLEMQDIRIMTSLAGILSYSTVLEEQEAAETLARHVLTYHTEDFDMVSLLMELLPKLPENEVRRELKDILNDKYEVLLENWIAVDARNFVALLWYARFERSAPSDPEGWIPDRFSSLYYGDAPHLFENRRGWVLLWGWIRWRRDTLKSAREAFEKAISLRSDCAPYYFDLGQCLEWQHDFRGARVAYTRAVERAPGDRDYAAGLASAVNQIGNGYWSEGLYTDAADFYAQAAALIPDEAVYHHNLAEARDASRWPDELQALTGALPAAEQAAQRDPANARYPQTVRRFQSRIAALKTYGTSEQSKYALLANPVTLWYGADLAPVASMPAFDAGLQALAESMANNYIPKFKFSIPVPAMPAWPDPYIGPNSYIFAHSDISTIESGVLWPAQKFCLASDDELKAAGLTGDPATDPLSGIPGAWLESKDWPAAENNQLPLLEPVEVLFRHLRIVLLSRLHYFLGHQDVMSFLNDGPAELRAIARSFEQASWLTLILKALLAERVPVTDFDGLCDAFQEHYGTERPSVIVRKMRMLPGIREVLWGNSKRWTQIFLSPELEALLTAGLKEAGPWTILALKPDPCQQVLQAIRDHLADVWHPRNPGRLVLVTSQPGIRPHVRTLVEQEFPDLPVLSTEELTEKSDERLEIGLS